MAPLSLKAKSPKQEAAIGFVLGTLGGCALGATEGPLKKVMSEMISGTLLNPVKQGVKTVGALGLGTLLGAAALTTAMTVTVMGVTVAATVALLFLGMRKGDGGPIAHGGLVSIAAGLAAAVSATSAGAALGFVMEKIAAGFGMVGILWALAIFTALKPLMHVMLQHMQREQECCGILGATAQAREEENRKLEAMETEQRERVTVEIEHRINELETEKKNGEGEGPERRAVWEARRREREEIERQQREKLQADMDQRAISERINKVVVKYVEFLAFAGIPMTATATVTAGFGVFGFGDYRFVFVVLLALVLFISFTLMRSARLNFWIFTGIMGMFATFAIAVLTVHAGQEVAGMSVRMRMAGHNISKEDVSVRMTHRSSLEALGAGFFVAKMCQVGLGATVGGPLGREIEGKVILGSAAVTVVILSVVEVASSAVGVGATAGALLGALGAAGVSLGAAASVAVGWSSWLGTIGTTAGMVLGALAIGKWDVMNIGLQVPVAYVFAMTNPY